MKCRELKLNPAFRDAIRQNRFFARTAAMFGHIDRSANLIIVLRVEFRNLKSCDQAESTEVNDRRGFQELQPGR